MKKILLYSGGSDSWLIDKLWKPDVKVYVDMKTRYSEQEIKKLNKDVKIIEFPLGKYEREDAIIPLRNLYLPMVICNEFPEEDLDICLGATAGDRVLDKSFIFADSASALLTYLYSPQHWIPNGRRIHINIDYKNYTKTQILKMFVEQGGDINEAFNCSFSCYNPINGKECWQCKPCFRKFVSFALNGMKFNKEIVETVVQYIKKEIMPSILNGTYGRKQEELEIAEVLKLYEDGQL